MKRLRRILGNLLAVALTITSLQAMAETQVVGRDFNHMTTGYPLSGGHATAACESCHMGGVFKGTPKNCDGCHAVGKRVLATPKSNAHIMTDAQCESCHFNTSTWLGARYNHGTAVPGQCKSCHNGRQALNKPATHNTGSKATASCDNCHRSSAWSPNNWNHIGVVPGSCATCHNGTTATGKTGTHTTTAKATFACDDCHSFTGWLPARYTHTSAAACSSCHNGTVAIGKTGTHTTTAKATYACNDCHSSTTSWLPARYMHTSSAACSSCHNGTVAIGKHAGHIATTDECNQCHTGTVAWLPALGAKPANHIPYNASVACSSCHAGSTVVTGTTLHAYLSTYACTTCHLRNNAYAGWGQDTKSMGHEGWSSGDCSQSGCHRPVGSRGTSYINWD